ncbi:hypothetical protein HHI36_001961 [Cryptolaemus montrouzieri]|uniref:Uncharacterized protein n=1 Tax=Cryptolaemus montrouzieri TaxID=559131 RepID=A0ABD2P958_9CUCU
MNSTVAVVFFAIVAAASAGLIAPSGIIASTYTAPAYSAYAAPLAAAYVSPFAAPLAYSAPLATGYLGRVAAENTVVAGPSGTIATSKSIGAPAIAAGYAAYPYGGLYL